MKKIDNNKENVSEKVVRKKINATPIKRITPIKPLSNKSIKVVFLGGLNQIGKNMTAIEFGNDIILIDCGTAFPDGTMLGIDLVIPDFSYVEKNKDRICGLIITHGHEDHIGAVP